MPSMNGHDPLVESAVATGRNGRPQHRDGDNENDDQ